MTDTRTKEQRHRIMAAVHSKNTSPELLVRRYLWSHGIRYRIHLANLPGKPDISIPRYKIAIFVHGCFWHGHENCSLGRLPKSKVEYWRNKIGNNKLRDRRVIEQLEAEGWRCIIIWHCQLRTKHAANKTLPIFLTKLKKMLTKGRVNTQ
jgi:DNA mismatch endonuclease, patch repair protein